MRKISAELHRDIDFAGARRGPLRAPPVGKTKISIRLDTTVLEHFRRQAEAAGGGSYQSMINDALIAQIQRDALATELRRVVREELRRALEKGDGSGAGSTARVARPRRTEGAIASAAGPVAAQAKRRAQ